MRSPSFSLLLCCAVLLLPSATALAFVPLDSSQQPQPQQQPQPPPRDPPLRTITTRNLFGFAERRTIPSLPAAVVWDPSRAANLVNEVFVRRRRSGRRAARLASQRREEEDEQRRGIGRQLNEREEEEGELAEGDEEEDELDEEDDDDDDLLEGEGEGDDGWYKRRLKRRTEVYATSQSSGPPTDGETAASGRRP
ncbi:hypothetical protein JCM5296_006204 [Sporobolomyces johnsonii]